MNAGRFRLFRVPAPSLIPRLSHPPLATLSLRVPFAKVSCESLLLAGASLQRLDRGSRPLQELLRIDVDDHVVAWVFRQDFFEETMEIAEVGGAGEKLEAPLAAEALEGGRSRS